MQSSSHRTLLQALIVSLLIHAVLLLSVVRQFPVRLDAPATTIRVVMGREITGEAAQSASTPPVKTRTEPIKPAASVVRHAAVPKLAVQEPSATEVAAASPARSVAQDVVPAAKPATGSGVAGGNEAPVAAPVHTPPRENVSADDLRQYRVSLATATRRFKRYPPLAKERGWEGTVEVALDVHALLAKPEIVLVRSSGREILDEQALEMVAQAARMATLPEGLKGRDFRVLLPVKFSLEGDQ